MNSNLHILIVEDERAALEALEIGLKTEQWQIATASSRNEALNLLKSERIDLVVTDLKLKDGSGLDILNYIKAHHPRVSLIVITAHGSVDSAIEAIRGGAYDYIQKPFRMAELRRVIQRLGETILLRRENELLRQQLQGSQSLPELVGQSPRFRKIIEFIKQIAPAQSTVLITGESGTGKEVAATAIHHYSNRRGGPFVKINCGAIPENLLESELFGYEKGAFTGAQKQKKGKIELADDGTLFLDEIGDLARPMQVKLLRVLQDGEIERVGGTVTIQTDVRIVAATNTDLAEKVARGEFREDLFYRLNVISIDMPPLRERPEDVPLLAQYFVEKYNQINQKSVEGIAPEVLEIMKRYPWKGNVRELENMIERAVVLAQEKYLGLHHFPDLAGGVGAPQHGIGAEIGMSLAEIEKLAIERTLQYFHFDKNKTAMILQIGLATLYRKIKEYELPEK